MLGLRSTLSVVQWGCDWANGKVVLYTASGDRTIRAYILSERRKSSFPSSYPRVQVVPPLLFWCYMIYECEPAVLSSRIPGCAIRSLIER